MHLLSISAMLIMIRFGTWLCVLLDKTGYAYNASIWPSHVLTQVMFRLYRVWPCELLTLGNTKTNGFDEVLSSRSASGVPLLSKHCINTIYQNTLSNHLITYSDF